MIKIQKLKIIIMLVVFIPFLATPSVFAAQVNLSSDSQNIRVSDQFEVGVFLNTEDADINAIEGKIVFPETFLELKEIRDGNSIINFWIERPKTKRGETPFSGIIPGGYIDKKGLIFSVVFQALQEGQGSIEIRDIKALLNDGKGTEAKTGILNLEFRILKTEGQIPDSKFQIPPDTDMPEAFELIVTRDPTMFDGKYFLVFATQDKGSGIDRYEVLERREFRIQNLGFRELIKKFLYPKSYILNSWTIAESPYVFQDQELRSFVWIKAVDKAGNERIAVVEPRYPLKWYENWVIWVIIISGVIVLYIIRKILWKK